MSKFTDPYKKQVAHHIASVNHAIGVEGDIINRSAELIAAAIKRAKKLRQVMRVAPNEHIQRRAEAQYLQVMQKIMRLRRVRALSQVTTGQAVTK